MEPSLRIRGEHRGIGPAQSRKLLMSAPLNDATGPQEEDLVRQLRCPQAVGDRQSRASSRSEGSKHLALGLRVKGARGLVEDEQLGIAEERSRQSKSLSLSATEPKAPLTNHRVQSMRQRCHHRIQPGFPHRGFQLRWRGPRPGIGEVVANGLVENHHVLRHHGHPTAELIRSDVPHVNTVEEHSPGGSLVEPRYQPSRRALSAS
mmetsp:Transcript_56328/g.121870  ORF Transcript_56328/g.121870 Transcript_56328/m.121870 type:complete len:205 (-) Transcript_56328:348-962(-)